VRFGAQHDQEKATIRQFIIHIPGQFVHPVAPTVISTDSGDEDKISTTWSVSDAHILDSV